MTDLERALMLAEHYHANQRYGVYPYMYHINQVIDIAEQFCYEPDIIISCALHDILEDTNLSYNDLKTYFNEDIAEIVYAVTDELGRDRNERKSKTYPKIKSNWRAIVVKMCDRIANIEHSKLYDPQLFGLYMREHKDFIENIIPVNMHSEIERCLNRLEKSI